MCVDGQPVGLVGDEPTSNGNGEYTLWYPSGTPGCGTEVVFFCARGTEGIPTLQDASVDCVTSIHWGTSYVCEPAAEPAVGNDCTVQSPVTGKYFDLKLLGNVVNVEGITICQEEGTPTSCDGAGVCVEGESYGKYNTALTFVDDGAKGELFLEFKDGPSCSSGMQRHSKIEFMCDPAAGAGSPKMVNNDGGCSFYYQWHTAYACPDQNSIECYVLGPNQESYDLSPLTRTSGESWSAEIDNDASYQYNYLVNVCSELTSPVTNLYNRKQLMFGRETGPQAVNSRNLDRLIFGVL